MLSEHWLGVIASDLLKFVDGTGISEIISDERNNTHRSNSQIELWESPKPTHMTF